MAETTTLRLMAAAKEFNIGKDTLVDFLVSKGFSKDDLKPTSKLTEDMYRSLQQEFQGDKVAKIKSDQIDLPKGSLEAKKKKEEETLVLKKEIVKKVKEEAPVEEPPAVVQPPVVEHKEEEPAVVKIEAPELEGPKVVDKIDLSAIDSSTRPKKGPKKGAEKESAPEGTPETTGATAPETASENGKPVAPKEEPKREEAPVLAGNTREEVTVSGTAKETTEDTPASDEPEVPPVIENIKAEKLEGPKILGKIDLPTNNDTRPKPPAEEKRKRKRIPIEKKDNNTGGGGRPHGAGGQQHGGAGQHGGGHHGGGGA
ncbi:MAG TPA: hypothetical protein VNU72_12380, partial [Puia sp.]|nr:hypothetical protein [Puia sp.]